ncbi:TonB-dependent receptor plug domain-containing protein [Chryseobacterium oranimense]|uniref:TonB-dependent receptor plug domain-containing protein n=1 Tax=Chryseobacterium oranimense TaxID=421058 RepID=UPI0021AE3AD2|nr:TonB-dependent receptor plug domain-containing protein [Chryseobacterium oranimense]UWX61182.1 TonB-dependent receptor plug domain-containing protein [Chryseobacterium oranimense]
MENNQDIDKRFNEASKLSEEPAVFPGFDKVWTKVEEKLDKKEEKKRILPVWFPYGVAASLVIGLGVFYFISKNKTVDISKPVIVENRIEARPEKNTVQVVDSIVKSNIQKEIEVSKSSQKAPALAYEPEVIKKAGDSRYNEIYSSRKPEYSTNEYLIKKKDETVTAIPERRGGQWKDTTKTQEIEEVVMVAAMGVKKKVDMVTSSSTITVTSTEKPGSMSVASALSGKVAGLEISSGSGKSSEIRIRGSKSISTGKPLFVVDGKVFESDLFSVLDAKNVKELRVIKGAEAAALYGSKASDGVILVTTKGLSKSDLEKLKEEVSKKAEETIKEPEPELPKAGQLTAGEVNDFSKWDYWKDIAIPTLDEYKNTWKFFPDKRVSVQLVNKNRKPVIGEKLKLLNDKKQIIWEAVSNNLGNAELWIDPMKSGDQVSGKFYLADGSGQIISSNIRDFRSGQNLIILDKPCITHRNLDLAFVVDATGSMGDEISYLQSELLDVLRKVESNLKNTTVRYGSVFYRDQGDEYVTRKFDFSDKAEDLVSFIKKQTAGGGGDTPEAVVEAMQVSIDDLKWSSENSAKIMFLILDAPPHHSDENINKLYEKIKLAAQKGITVIPLAASDTDKQTEYLMRTFALLTNGTYTFLTNDSGIGNDHIKPTIDSYEVEKLNALLLRLILQRATLPECSDGISNDYLNKKLETEVNNQPESRTVIFPNPTKGVINIKSGKVIDELFLYDLAGKIIMRKENLSEGKNTIDITSYPQSIYLLRLRTKDQWETFKVIKN